MITSREALDVLAFYTATGALSSPRTCAMIDWEEGANSRFFDEIVGGFTQNWPLAAREPSGVYCFEWTPYLHIEH